MALDRQDIQKRDFPIARRGYDPDAVDAHLRSVADELDSARREQRPSQASLSGAASEQVRAIVEAAEGTAAGIRAKAEEEARSHVSQVEDAAKTMLQRVEAMESELDALVESLRTGAGRLTADLALLRDSMGELRTAGAGPAVEEPVAAEPQPDPDEGKGPTVEVPGEADGAATPDDSEGARLIALNMALNGTPREETDRYLADNFQLEDRQALLDEVYARVG